MITSSARTLTSPHLGQETRTRPNITKDYSAKLDTILADGQGSFRGNNAAKPCSWRHPQSGLRIAIVRRRFELSPSRPGKYAPPAPNGGPSSGYAFPATTARGGSG